MTHIHDLSRMLAAPDGSAGFAGPVGTLILASLAIMGTPGPSTMSLVAAVVVYGVRHSLAYCAGLVAGTMAVLLAVATGVTAVLLAVPAPHGVLVVAAIGYILWLAYHLATAPPLAEQTPSDRRPSFTTGMVLGIINPKAWIAIAAVFASARLAGGALADAALKIPLLTLMVVFIHLMWLVAGGLLMPALRHPGRTRATNIALAALMVVAGGLALLP
jgi:threonine/homoserine/homoserine lactone efflux protein